MKPSPKPTCSHDWFVAINNANLDATQRSVMFAAVTFMTWTTGGDIRPSRKVWGAKAGVTDRCMTTRLAQLKSLGLLREVEPSTATTTTTYAADYDRLLALAREGVEDSSSLEDSSTGKVFQSGWKNVRVRVENSSTNHNQYHNQDHNQSGCVQGLPDSGGTTEPAPPAPKRKKRNASPKADVVFPEGLQSEAFATAWREWEQYRREKRDEITPTTAAKQLKKLAALGERQAIACIEQSIERGWTGLFPNPTPAPAPSPDKEAAIRARIAFYERHPQTRQAHIAALKAMDPRYAKASDASILRAMPDAMLAMPATPATTNGITNA